ncbi:MAG: terminase small subunit [SAR324 cluster bacterium]|nr:terminase small subunit [SAR324 cluster bacterium]
MKDFIVTIDELSKIVDLSERRIRQLTAEGIISKCGRGKYDLRSVYREMVVYSAEKMIPKQEKPETQSDDPQDIEISKARLVAAQADREELRLFQERGELILVSDYEKILGEMAFLIKNKLLSIPPRLSPILYPVNTQSETNTLLKKHINGILVELSDLVANRSTRPSSDSGSREETKQGLPSSS